MSKTGEVEALIDNTVMTWYSDDANVATVDANGLIKAVTQGNTNIHAVLASTDIALPVTVQTPATRYKSLFGEAELALTKSGLKSDATVTKTGEGFDLDFTVSSTRGTYVGIKTNANTFAIPDSLRMSINPGTAEITKIVFSYVSVDGRTKYVTFTPEFTQHHNGYSFPDQ